MPDGILVAVTDHAAERYRQRVGTRTGSVDVKPEIVDLTRHIVHGRFCVKSNTGKPLARRVRTGSAASTDSTTGPRARRSNGSISLVWGKRESAPPTPDEGGGYPLPGFLPPVAK